MGPNYYPPGGHDWVSSSDIRRAQAHTEALLVEKYFHDVAAFRDQFFGKLATHGAMHEGLGWALFNGEDDEAEDTDSFARREVLLTCRFRPEAVHKEVPVPLIRVITNEPYVTDAGLSYLTEDATIFEDGRATYFVGAVRVKNENGDHVDDVTRTVSPLFFVAEGNKLFVTGNAGALTPHFMLQDESLPDDRVFPFGSATGEFVDNLENYIYALDSARGILHSVLDDEPSHAYGRVA